MAEWTPAFETLGVNTRPAHCRSCGAEIRWATTLKGKGAPINRDGTSHFSTCPSWNLRRKPE